MAYLKDLSTLYIKESTCCNFTGLKQNNVCGNMEISSVSSPLQQNRPCHPILDSLNPVRTFSSFLVDMEQAVFKNVTWACLSVPM
jgi:hypothetical protein